MDSASPLDTSNTLLTVKIKKGDDNRRFRIPIVLSFEALTDKIIDLYEDVEDLADFRVTFKDDEGDLVTITSDAELADAVEFSTGQILRLFLVEKPRRSRSCPRNRQRSTGNRSGRCRRFECPSFARANDESCSVAPPSSAIPEVEASDVSEVSEDQETFLARVRAYFDEVGARMKYQVDRLVNSIRNHDGQVPVRFMVPFLKAKEVTANFHERVKELFRKLKEGAVLNFNRLRGVAMPEGLAANPFEGRLQHTSSLHDHPLYLIAVEDAYPTHSWICDRCSYRTDRDAPYHCDDCNFDLCVRCIYPEGNQPEEEPHRLNRYRRRRTFWQGRPWRCCRQKRPRSQFLADITMPDGQIVRPGERFLKVWRIRNNGRTHWPEGVTAKMVRGYPMGAPESVVVTEGRSLPNGAPVDVEVSLVAPLEPGTYSSYWRLFSPIDSRPFGCTLWVTIVVEERGDLRLDVATAEVPEVPEVPELAEVLEVVQGVELLTMPRPTPGDISEALLSGGDDLDGNLFDLQFQEVRQAGPDIELVDESVAADLFDSFEVVTMEDVDAATPQAEVPEEVVSIFQFSEDGDDLFGITDGFDPFVDPEVEVAVSPAAAIPVAIPVAAPVNLPEQETEQIVTTEETLTQAVGVPRNQWHTVLRQLHEMGFTDPPRNLALLNQYNGDISAVLSALLQ